MREHLQPGHPMDPLSRLRAVGLRPTRQRIALCRQIFSGGDRHVTAEALHGEAVEAGLKVSLATVYNTLHQMTRAGLLKEVSVDGAKTYFDTNTSQHHHFFRAETGELHDISGASVVIDGLPDAPEGLEIERVDVIVRLKAGRG